jgi:uncharacterized protein YhjY with autotransporter beta-barrel domain
MRNSNFSSIASLTLLCLLTAGRVHAQVVYSQGFDNPVGANGDVYFTTAGVYNGVTDGTFSGTINTGASFAGNGNDSGLILANFGPITPQSGGFFLGEGTSLGPSYVGTVFSTQGTGITIMPNSTYRLTFYLAVESNQNQPEIQASINGTNLGGPVTPSVVGAFQQFTLTYNSGANTNALIVLANGTATGNGNDFGLDTIQLALAQTSFPLAGLTPNQTAVALNLSSGALGAVSNAVLSTLTANPSSYPAVLDQLSPLEFGRFAFITAFNNASFENEAMDNYLATQRGGPDGTFIGSNSGIDSSGLVLNDPSYDPTLSMVHSRLMAWNPGPFNGTESDIAPAVIGAIDPKDAKDVKTVVTPSSPSDMLHFFVRGNVILGQGLSQQDAPHFDENTEEVHLGADYRITPNVLVGLKASYGHTDVTLDNNGSSATVDSYSPGIYASFADKGWYANLTGDYLHNAYTQQRNISFLGQNANSAPEGNEGMANLDGGYDFHTGALTYGPISGVQYTHLTVNGYSETGSIADLTVNEQQSDSLRSRLGGRLSYAIDYFGMTFHPHIDATWQHEFMDQSRGITSQFDGSGLGSFSVVTENPQRDSALVTVGGDADINGMATVFLEYMVQAGQDNYFGQSVQGGVRIGF